MSSPSPVAKKAPPTLPSKVMVFVPPPAKRAMTPPDRLNESVSSPSPEVTLTSPVLSIAPSSVLEPSPKSIVVPKSDSPLPSDVKFNESSLALPINISMPVIDDPLSILSTSSAEAKIASNPSPPSISITPSGSKKRSTPAPDSILSRPNPSKRKVSSWSVPIKISKSAKPSRVELPPSTRKPIDSLMTRPRKVSGSMGRSETIMP